MKNIFSLIAFFLVNIAASAQNKADSTATITPDSIERIFNLGSQDDTARINEIIGIRLQSAKPASAFAVLYVNGIRVDKLKPWKISEPEKTVFFQLGQPVVELMSQFVGEKATNNNIVPVYFSVGDQNTSISKFNSPIYLVIKQKIKPVWAWVLVVMLVILVGIALWKKVLKDENHLYYSLGRAQLFYWTLLFVTCFLILCFQTDTLPDIPGSVLVILGISLGTTAAAKVIENSNRDKIKLDPNAKSEGFLLDILSDGTNINIHRFQNVIFHLVFGLIFLQKTLTTHLLPSFDNNVLLLLGISSGAYAGLKITESTKDQNQPLPQTYPETKPPGEKTEEKIHLKKTNDKIKIP